MFEMLLTRVGRRVLDPRGIQLSHDHHDNNDVSHEHLKYFLKGITIAHSITKKHTRYKKVIIGVENM
jgi:hypothetical protein